MDTIRIVARISRKEIIYVNSLLEARDGIAVMSTVDAGQGLIEFQVSPDFLDEMASFLAALSSELSADILENGRAAQTKNEPSSSL